MGFINTYDVKNFVKYNGVKGAVKYFRELFETNVVGNFNLYSLFTPLIFKRYTKKILLISSGQTDLIFLIQYQIEVLVAYAVNKAVYNVITAKFHARYAKKSVLRPQWEKCRPFLKRPNPNGKAPNLRRNPPPNC
ncbi:hypothetical protein PoMZ_02528 [Pyricularia oryzae]|uniref:Uncharacterized protein n=1 Tax=Pyricularia oryzae TaxID=318829 RepID=A0A4P7N505_PYROR|nr:hypothetical protein PoMZ_02528 [Pyricularia oryzae]